MMGRIKQIGFLKIQVKCTDISIYHTFLQYYAIIIIIILFWGFTVETNLSGSFSQFKF